MWKIMRNGVAVKKLEDKKDGTLSVFIPEAFYTLENHKGRIADVLKKDFEDGTLDVTPDVMYFRNGVPYVYKLPCSFHWDSGKMRYVYTFHQELSRQVYEEFKENPFQTPVDFETCYENEIYLYSRTHKGYDFHRDVTVVCDFLDDFDVKMRPDGTWYIVEGSEYKCEISKFKVLRGYKDCMKQYVCMISH